MTEEKIKEFIAEELGKYADGVIASHLNDIEQEMKKKSKEMIVRAMEECRIRVAQDDSTMQTVIRIDFGRF